MKTLAQDKTLIILAAAVAIVFLALLLLMFFSISNPNKTTNISTNATPIPLPKDTNTNYSNLNKLTPGSSTLEEVEKINGVPSRESKVGDKTYLYYQTPVKGLENKVLIRYGVVIYAFENVYADYRGKYDSYTKPFGSPDVTLFSADGFNYPWYVFLDKGVAVQSTGNYITGIIYFSPQNKLNFMANIANDFGLSTNEPQNSEFTPAL